MNNKKIVEIANNISKHLGISRDQMIFVILIIGTFIAASFLFRYIIVTRKDIDEEGILKKIQTRNAKKIIEKQNKHIKRKEEYEETKRTLDKYGATFHHSDLNEYNFKSRKILFAIVFAILAFLITSNIIAVLPGFIFGYVFLDLDMRSQNKKDNIQINKDLLVMLGVIKIHCSSNTNIVMAISECSSVARSKRLKKALMEMSGDIRREATFDDAINNLKMKFMNRNIDSFCVTLTQLSKNGIASNMMESISKEITRLTRERNNDEKNKLDLENEVSLMVLFSMITLIIIMCTLQSFGTISM